MFGFEPCWDAASVVRGGLCWLSLKQHLGARIFLSCRRQETAYPAGWRYDRPAEQYAVRCSITSTRSNWATTSSM